ncbi:oxygenase MpaB family protein [Streptomyces tremellae]|uniref:ER-bound oxygenase mpaB/mpaB'/Rubber oxygenase catalytic domain-containing protein n=1 Tax=Streptomyces tremellae TaxID=1124239 RepID=A0ABP7DL75_9ACTN
MTTAQDPLQFPARLVNLEAAQDKHGEKADHMARMLMVGDPLADAVIVEIDALGKEARRTLSRGLNDGLDSLDNPPPAIEALLRQLETVPDWISQESLAAGDETSLLVPPRWNALAFSGGSLAHTYSSPSIAKLLVQTGKLDLMAPRRLAETSVWKASVVLPGGLLRGGPGYVQTAQVRLLHARIRSSALKHGWDTQQWGVPINQVDIARTWLDFTVVPFAFLARAGIVTNEDEQQGLYQHWWYIAHLLGLNESFFLDIGDHAAASGLLELLDSTITPPDDNARVLVNALFDSTTDVLSSQPNAVLTKEGARELLNALARLYHGDARADALGIPASTATPLLPVIAAGNAQVRRYQTTIPEAAAQERAVNIEQYRALVDSLPGRTEYQSHAEAAK